MKERERENNEEIKEWSQSLFVTQSQKWHSISFCHALFVRRKTPAHTPCPVPTPEERVTQGCGYQEARITVKHFRGCLPQINSEIANMKGYSTLNLCLSKKIRWEFNKEITYYMLMLIYKWFRSYLMFILILLSPSSLQSVMLTKIWCLHMVILMCREN